MFCHMFMFYHIFFHQLLTRLNLSFRLSDLDFIVCVLQDCRIAERIEGEGKACIIVVNKWDTIPNKNQQTATYYEQDVREKLRILHWAPIVYSTAIAGQNVDKYVLT